MKRLLNNERGIVLLVVLSVVMLMMTLVTSFQTEEGLDYTHARNYQGSVQAKYLADAGIEAMMACYMERESSDYDHPDEDWWRMFNEYKLMASAFLDGMIINPELEDECSKLNINDLVYKDEDGSYKLDEFKKKQFMALFDLLGLDYTTDEFDTLCQSILDWIDEDDIAVLEGAEREYYQILSPPYEAKNAPFDTIQELLLVRGMKREWFYNTDDDNRGLEKYITAGKPSGGIKEPGQLINLNTASLEVLLSLVPGIDESTIEEIIVENRPLKKDNFTEVQNSFLATSAVQSLSEDDQEELKAMIGIRSSCFLLNIKTSLPTGANMQLQARIEPQKRKRARPSITYYRIY